MKFRDSQKSKCYSWEQSVCPRYDRSRVAFDQIQSVVNHVWASEGLIGAPMVKPLHGRDQHGGKALRHTVWFQKDHPTSTWIILHELAHSMTSTVDDASNHHGDLFVGVYMRLLEKYIGIPLPVLMYTATKDRVKYDLKARPFYASAKSA